MKSVFVDFDEAVHEEKGFFVIGSRDHKLRIPNHVHVSLVRLIEPNPNDMDRRMYRLTRAGRTALRKGQERPPKSC